LLSGWCGVAGELVAAGVKGQEWGHIGCLRGQVGTAGYVAAGGEGRGSLEECINALAGLLAWQRARGFLG